jgi:apolipoprotein N-acyltransferase
METNSPRTAWLEASTAFLVLYAVSGYWVLRHPIWESAAASLGAGLLLPFLQAIPFAAAVPIRNERGPLVGIAALATFSLAGELAFLHTPLGLPWFLLGHSQAEALMFNQFVDMTGVLGLSLWLWMLNGTAWYLTRTTGFHRLTCILMLGIFLLTPYLYGAFRQTNLHTETSLSIGVIQPALPARTWANGAPTQRMNRLYDLTDSLMASPGSPPALMVWPETALPYTPDPDERQRLYHELRTWSATHGTPLIAGTVRAAHSEKASADLPYNSAALFRGQGSVTHYDKRKLVPFAEYVPGAEYWGALTALGVNAGGVPGYQKGRGSGLLSIDSTRFAVQICFESLFGHLPREAFQKNASFLLVLAQNGWWGNSAGPYQHQAFTRLRAIESRRSVLLASASGTTSLIRADGRISRELDWMRPSATRFEVPTHRIDTSYVRYGDWPGYGAAVVTLLVGLIYAARRFFGFRG